MRNPTLLRYATGGANARDKAQFQQFGSTLKGGVQGKPVPTNGIAVPTEHAVVQGSAVYRPAADDVDVALLVTQDQFDRLIEQSFPNQVRSVRARGVDPLRMAIGDAQSAAERTLANAVETGILKRDKVVPRLSDVRDQLQALLAGKKARSRRSGQRPGRTVAAPGRRPAPGD